MDTTLIVGILTIAVSWAVVGIVAWCLGYRSALRAVKKANQIYNELNSMFMNRDNWLFLKGIILDFIIQVCLSISDLFKRRRRVSKMDVTERYYHE